MIFCVVKHSIFSWNRNDFSSLKQLPSSNFCPWNCYQKVQSLITKIHHGEKKHQIHHLEVKMMTKGLWHDIWSLNNNSNSFALKVVFRHESFLSQEYSNQMGLKWESRFSRLFSWGTNFCTKTSFCIKLQSFCLNKHTSVKHSIRSKTWLKFKGLKYTFLQTVVLSFWQEKYPCHDGQKSHFLRQWKLLFFQKYITRRQRLIRQKKIHIKFSLIFKKETSDGTNVFDEIFSWLTEKDRPRGGSHRKMMWSIKNKVLIPYVRLSIVRAEATSIYYLLVGRRESI